MIRLLRAWRLDALYARAATRRVWRSLAVKFRLLHEPSAHSASDPFHAVPSPLFPRVQLVVGRLLGRVAQASYRRRERWRIERSRIGDRTRWWSISRSLAAAQRGLMASLVSLV